MRRIALTFAVGILMSFTQARAADYPDTPAGLESLTNDIIQALKADKVETAKELIKGLVLPNSEKWFVVTWGDETGKPMAEQYAKMSATFPEQALKIFQDQLKQNRTNIKAYKVESADDKEATGLQSSAITAMKVKVPLYGVRLVAPGKELGMHLWSFVYVDGGFRMIGKVGQKR